MLCGVTATLGSNPSATATAARPQWGRAVLLCLGDVLCCCVAVLPHGCFGRRRACQWGRAAVCAGGRRPAREPSSLRAAHAACCCLWRRWCSGRRRSRPPARSPHASFARSGRSRSPPVPSGPSGALHTSGARSLMCALRVDSLSGQAPPLPINFARNSPAACSNIECASLELQRFGASRKMTTINYVRLLVSAGSAAAFGCWGRTLRPFLRSSSLRRWGFCTT